MPANVDKRQIFTMDAGKLVRTIDQGWSRSYRHTCTLDSYTRVVHYVTDHAEEGVTTNDLWKGLPDVPSTQAAVALAFLKERGCVAVRGRRWFPASPFLFEDALCEFHALAFP